MFEPAAADVIGDLSSGDRIIVLSWFDQAARDMLRTRPGDDPAAPERGVFSTRSPAHPNPIGLHRVEVLAVDRLRVRVAPLKALDGTPIADVKPVLDSLRER